MPAYKYVLTPKTLVQTQNSTIKILVDQGKGEFAWTKEASMAGGWTDLIKDLTRVLTLRGSWLSEEVLTLLKAIVSRQINQPERILAELGENLAPLFNIHPEQKEEMHQIEALLKHYSQTPLFLVGYCASDYFVNQNSPLRLNQPEPERPAQTLLLPSRTVTPVSSISSTSLELAEPLLIKERALTTGKMKGSPAGVLGDLTFFEGRIHLNIHLTRLPIKNPDKEDDEGKAKTVFYLEGPLEAQFVLDPKKGFVLKEISTDSKFWYDLFMGGSSDLLTTLRKLEDREEDMREMYEVLVQQTLNQPESLENLKRHCLKEILNALDEYRKGNIPLELLVARARDLGISSMRTADKEFSAAVTEPFAELVQKLLPQHEPEQRQKEILESHSTFKERRQTESVQQAMAQRSPLDALFIEDASTTMKLACDSVMEAVSAFMAKNPQRYGSGMLGSNLMFQDTDHDDARKLQKTARDVFPKDESIERHSAVEPLKNYVKFVSTLMEVVSQLDSNSKLLEEMNSRNAVGIALASIGLLTCGKKDEGTTSSIQMQFNDYIDWLKSALEGCLEHKYN